MKKRGFKVTIVGNSFEKAVLFFESEPNDTDLERLIQEHKGSKAFITSADVYESGNQ